MRAAQAATLARQASNMTPNKLFDRIASDCPSFRGVLGHHMKDQGELLSHLLMADLLRFIGSGLGTASNLEAQPPSHEEIRLILGILDQAFVAGDEATTDAICLSFIEHIETEPFFTDLEPMLGPALRAQHARQREWWQHAR